MDFLRTLLVIGIVLVTIQFFIWLLPFVAVIVLILWGVKYFKGKFNNKNEEVNNTTYSNVYSIDMSDTDNVDGKEIVDVEYKEV